EPMMLPRTGHGTVACASAGAENEGRQVRAWAPSTKSRTGGHLPTGRHSDRGSWRLSSERQTSGTLPCSAYGTSRQDDRDRPTRRAVLGTAALGAIGLAGCSNSARAEEPAGTSGSSSGKGSWPVQIDHAFGQTVIESEPQRVATVNWGNHEVPLALGIVPVGMAKTMWGDDDGDGIHPWV